MARFRKFTVPLLCATLLATAAPSRATSSTYDVVNSVILGSDYSEILDLAKGNDEFMWLSTGKLVKFEFQTETYQVAEGMESYPGHISEITQDVDGNIWFYDDSDLALGVYNPNTHAYYEAGLPVQAITARTEGGVYISSTVARKVVRAWLAGTTINIDNVSDALPADLVATGITEDSSGTGIWATTSSTSDATKIVHINSSGAVTFSCDLTSVYSGSVPNDFSGVTPPIRIGNWIYFAGKGNGFVWSLNETTATGACTSTNLLDSSSPTLNQLHRLPDGKVLGAGYGGLYTIFDEPTSTLSGPTLHFATGTFDASLGNSNDMVIGPNGDIWIAARNTKTLYEIESGLLPALSGLVSPYIDVNGTPSTGQSLVPGDLLRINTGDWEYLDSSAGVTATLEKCLDSVCDPVQGVVDGTYTVSASDVGYQFRNSVQATNRNGQTNSASSSTGLVINTSDPVRSVKISQRVSRSLVFSWSAPASTHGSSVDKYKIVLNGRTYYTTGRSYTFTGLNPWQGYKATVYAHNAAGYSSSAVSASVKPQFYVKKKSKTKLTSIITPASSKGAKWSKSGTCKIKSKKLVAPKKSTTCIVTVKNGSTSRSATVRVQ